MFDRVDAMVLSMTTFEYTPKQLTGSRRFRIAHGSGVTVTEVDQLLERFGRADPATDRGRFLGRRRVTWLLMSRSLLS